MVGFMSPGLPKSFAVTPRPDGQLRAMNDCQAKQSTDAAAPGAVEFPALMGMVGLSCGAAPFGHGEPPVEADALWTSPCRPDGPGRSQPARAIDAPSAKQKPAR